MDEYIDVDMLVGHQVTPDKVGKIVLQFGNSKFILPVVIAKILARDILLHISDIEENNQFTQIP